MHFHHCNRSSAKPPPPLPFGATFSTEYLINIRYLEAKNLHKTNGFWCIFHRFFFEQLQQTLQNPMFLEQKTLKIIGFYKVIYISMHPIITNVDTYNDFWRKKHHVDTYNNLWWKKTCPKPMDFDDFGWFFSSDHFSKRYKIHCFWKKKR